MASMRCVRPDFTTLANSVALASREVARWSRAGISSFVADAIVAAADEVATGAHDAHFPIDVFQTGSGTSSNMNTNEVIATLATKALGKDVHPNDHVNASQSSNDVFPTSIHVAATASATNELIPSLDHLATSLEAKATEFATCWACGDEAGSKPSQ